MRYLSPSALNTLMEDPRLYKKRYITFDEDKTLPSDQIVLGSLIHSILASEPWEEKFIIPKWEVPSDTVQDIIWCYYNNTYKKVSNTELSDFDLTFEDDASPGSDKLLSLLKAFKHNQHLKTDKGRLENLRKAGAKEYFEHLKEHDGKVGLITEQDLKVAKEVRQRVEKNKRLKELINFDPQHFEKEIRIPYSNHFGLKGILDNHHADLEREVLYINDFKTSEKIITQYYKDLRWDTKIHNQVAQYDELLLKSNPDYADFQINRNIIYINQKNGDVYPFEVGDDAFTNWKNTWKSCLRKAEWHFENNSFDLPHDFENNLVSLRYENSRI